MGPLLIRERFDPLDLVDLMAGLGALALILYLLITMFYLFSRMLCLAPTENRPAAQVLCLGLRSLAWLGILGSVNRLKPVIWMELRFVVLKFLST